MKKSVVLIILLGFMQALTGCNSQINGETTPPAQEETNATVLNTPPVLTVIYGNESVEALKGTYSWTYSNGDDTCTNISADSMHPLQAREHMPQLDLASVDTSSDLPKVYLQWETIPDHVSVRSWNKECWGQTDSESENIPVKILGTDFIIELKDGNDICEISAEWNCSEFWGGTALYSFYTVRNNEPLEDREDLDLWSSEMEAVDNAISNLMQSEGFDDLDTTKKVEKMLALMNGLAENGTEEYHYPLIKVETIYYDGGDMITFEYAGGGLGGVKLEPFDPMMN